MRAYREAQLITNRVSVLLVGGSEQDRKAWALDAMVGFGEDGALFEARDVTNVNQAFTMRSGVVYVPDASQLSWSVQRELTRLLHEKEERPKFVLGIPFSLAAALSRGVLREDLVFALSKATLDLGSVEVKDSIAKRRKSAPKRAARR